LLNNIKTCENTFGYVTFCDIDKEITSTVTIFLYLTSNIKFLPFKLKSYGKEKVQGNDYWSCETIIHVQFWKYCEAAKLKTSLKYALL
jgi:hypothetical protein